MADVLTADQIRQLRDLPPPTGEGNEITIYADDPRHELPLQLAYRYRVKRQFRRDPAVAEFKMYRTHEGDVLLDTIDAIQSETRLAVLAEVDAAIEKVFQQSDAPVEFWPYDRRCPEIKCITDESIAGQFAVAGGSYTDCLFKRAAITPTQVSRDRQHEANIALVDAARQNGEQW